MAEARIDKWLWSVRIFKTRTIAADACKKGRISINGVQVKPSKTVHEGDTVQVRKPPVTYSFRVLQCIENRVGAKLVPEMMENITPKDQYDLLDIYYLLCDDRFHPFQKKSVLLHPNFKQ